MEQPRNLKQQKGLIIAKEKSIKKVTEDTWRVQSQKNCTKYHTIKVTPDGAKCSCPNWKREKEKCKHIYAIEYLIKNGYEKLKEIDYPEIKRKTYSQDWANYNYAQKIEITTYQALLNRLYMYTDGVFSFMNRETSLNFKSNFVCFNIGDMPKQVKPLVMFLILDYVYSKMKEDKQRKLLVIDEAWSLLGKAEEASYIFEIVKTCRKFNLGLLLITQDVEDLVASRAGAAVLSNSSYTLLLRQKPAVINNIVRTFHLSQLEKDYLLTATQGRGILIMDNDHQELEVVASPKEDEIITTNADQIIQVKEEKKEKLDVNITINLNRGLYFGSHINNEEKNYLGNNGYVVRNFVPIGKTRYEEVWIKENKVESLEHTFLVENIKQVIISYVRSVKVNVVKDVDLLVEDKQGNEIAIEVETGKGFKKHKKRILEKFRVVCSQYEKVII